MIRIQQAAVFCFLALVSVSHSAQIGPNEALTLTISGVPEADRADFNGPYTVAENGKINLPLLGWVQAAGLNTVQLANRVEQEYRKAQIYEHPTVNVKQMANPILVNKQVVVGGQVRRPGPVAFRADLTLWGAVQGAGGDNEFAAIRRVQLHRDGRMKVYDLRDNDAKHLPLRENDSVVMPQKRPFEGGW